MATLSSFLVERKLASPADMTEALARQAMSGGDLGTCLLELRAVREDALTSALAAVWGMEPAPWGELPMADAAVLRLVPGEMAHRFGFYPMTETLEGELLVAVSEPLQPALEEELSFALGVRFRQYAAALLRVRQAIARDYGIPMDKPLLSLLEQIEASPSAAPGRPRSGPLRLPRYSPTPVPGTPTPISSAPAPADDVSAERTLSTMPPEEFLVEAGAVTAAQLERKRRRRAEMLSSRPLVGWALRAARDTAGSEEKPVERMRGPITAAAAEAALYQVQAADAVLTLFFDFAKQYFEYAALFVVRGDLAEGRDAWGPGANKDKVLTIGVALDLPSSLATASQRKTPVLAPLGREGLDAVLAEDLGRLGMPGVLVLPIVVRERTVALLYGDHGSEPVEYGSVGDVVALAPLVASAFERILLRKKLAAKREGLPIQQKVTEPAPPLAELEPEGDERDRSPSEPAAEQPPGVQTPKIGRERRTSSEEELVDEGWALVAETLPAPAAPSPAPQAEIDSGWESEAEPARPVAREAVRPMPKQPPGQDEPEVSVSEQEDDATIRALLDELDQHPAPPVPFSEPNTAKRLMHRPTPAARGVGSRAISAEPQAPPPSVPMGRPLPAVLLHSDLVENVISGGEQADRALSEILVLGNSAIPAVFARFPGPLAVPRDRAVEAASRPADCGPVLKIVAAMRRLALPFLAVRSADAEAEVRFWSTYLLGELHYPDSANAILPRIFDEDPGVRRIALRGAGALLAHGDAGTPIRLGLERLLSRKDEPELRKMRAIEALVELRVFRSVPALIRALDDPAETVRQAVAEGLAALTRQSFGNDRRRWDDWWATKGRLRAP